jgi:hypothetical protein
VANLTYRAVDLQNGGDPWSSTIWFDLVEGYSEPAEVRGDDLVIPQKPGMTEMSKVKHRRVIELRGHVRGVGGTAVERAESWRAATDALMATMSLSAASGALVIGTPYLGLPSGSKTIQARCIDAIPGPILNRHSFQRWTFRLVAIGNPPEWS